MKLFDFKLFIEAFPQILSAAPTTILVSVISFLIAVLIGFVTAVIKLYNIPVLKRIAALYISFIRGTPVLVQLYIICYGIPKIIYYLQIEKGMFTNVDVNLIPAIYYVILAYSINIGAYLAETIRSSIEAVGHGQFEAAKSVGMTSAQAMRRIIIPQAFNVALPNLGNTVISAVKDTSLIFMAGVLDIMGKAKILGSRVFSYFEVYIAAALIYWAICLALELIFRLIEKKSKKFERKIV